MKDRHKPVPHFIGLSIMATTLFVMATGTAYADVVGRLHFIVKDAADKNEKPVPNAKIVLHDTAGTRADVTLTTDAQGNATSPQLEARAWQVKTTPEKADTYQPDTQVVTVVNDTTTDVTILLEPVKEKTVTIKATKETTNKRQTISSTNRDRDFIQKYPTSAGNPQDLRSVLQTVPGASLDTVNQLHIRDEHSATAIYLDGFYLPGALQGRAGALLNPDALQSIDILTGAYAPEYGGETAAILNINLRAGSIRPFANVLLEGGEYSTFSGALTLSGQLGAPIGAPDAAGQQARRFGYFMDFSARRTQNALEPPQPDFQTAHNTGSSLIGFGNFTYEAGPRDQFKLTVNSAPAYTQVANRAGLPAAFAAAGQGYGYIGLRNADGTVPSASDPTLLGAQPQTLLSQQAAGQDINTRDINDAGILSYRHAFNSRLDGIISVGMTHTGQDIRNNNPGINLLNLPVDNSIEFNPTIARNNHQVQFQGSLTYSLKTHTVKSGLLFDDQEGDEYYRFTPGSQLALDSLAVNAPNLAPAGTPFVDAKGNPVLDIANNQVYSLDKSKPNAPAISVHRAGFYRAGYIQDTWNINRKATLNYGIRGDWYKQTQNLGQSAISQINFSPRINFAYLLAQRTVMRLAYNRLFIQPPLAQGSIIGQPIQPETLDQFDFNVERQIARGQTLKVAYFYKEMKNQIDTGLLVPFTQIGVYSSVNFQRGHARGVELSYDLTPRNNVGLSAFLAYSNSLNKPTGLQNTGAPVPIYNDHDQLNTLSTGLAYTLKSGANAALSLYHGSGLASSVVFGTDAKGNGLRTQRTQVNASLASGSRLFGGSSGGGGRGGLTLSVENLFDDRPAINFNSGFSGTRFQQGRRVVLSLSGNF